MPLPIPDVELVEPDYSQDRGTILVDPITKSVVTKPSAFVIKNVCDEESWIKFSGSLTINQNTQDCDNVLAASISISGQIPAGFGSTNVDNYDLVVALLSNYLRDKLENT